MAQNKALTVGDYVTAGQDTLDCYRGRPGFITWLLRGDFSLTYDKHDAAYYRVKFTDNGPTRSGVFPASDLKLTASFLGT